LAFNRGCTGFGAAPSFFVSAKLSKTIRNLVVVLGDQLDRDSAAFDGFDPKRDVVWMAEVAQESTKVWSHKARIAVFLSAMRHFREELAGQRHWPVWYAELNSKASKGALGKTLGAFLEQHAVELVVLVEPGEWDVREEIRAAAKQAGVALEEREDRHFLCSRAEFAAHAKGRKQLRMEFFYREMRRKHDVLMEQGEPVGGAWNFDAENRGSFDKDGPGLLSKPVQFQPDPITRQVLKLVEEQFPEHPGKLQQFDWPVTPSDAQRALADFIENRLPLFGQYQDAMWTGEAWLYHSRIAAAMNLKLIHPREVIRAAEQAWQKKRAPLAAVEGFIRQILGWREYVRGIYWQCMPQYRDRNALDAQQPLPDFYWTGETEMNCLRHALKQTLELGYAHHIQRLMVTGLYALLLGVRPRAVHEWYLAVYVDAIEWVELPNTLGMSQYADGGVMASKPYAASGKYIQRMSNYCDGCRFEPSKSTGKDACPFTTLYWDFLLRHAEALKGNPRMLMQLRNLSRLDENARAAIRGQAGVLRKP